MDKLIFSLIDHTWMMDMDTMTILHSSPGMVGTSHSLTHSVTTKGTTQPQAEGSRREKRFVKGSGGGVWKPFPHLGRP
jgi:hypothetical protein